MSLAASLALRLSSPPTTPRRAFASLRRLALAPAASLLAALVLIAPAGVSAAPSGQVVIAQGSDIPTLDASMDISTVGLNVLRNVYSQLTVISADGVVLPDLATSWEASDGARRWIFTLRGDAKFHDGSPVTAADVLWTFNKIKNDARSPARAYLTIVSTMEEAGPGKISFTLAKPFSAFDRHVSLLPVLSEAAYRRLGPEQFAREPVGSGPFRVVRWIKDDRIELEAVPGHWGGEAKIKTVIFRPVASEAARFAALQAGDVDIVAGLPPVLVERLKGRTDMTVANVVSNRVVYLGANTNQKALADVRLRQAIDLAIDRVAIGQTLLRGLGKPVGQILAPMTFGFDSSIAPVGQNLEKARALVKASGYDGSSILLQYPNNRIALGNEVAQAVAGYLKAVGINVELQGLDYPAFFAIWSERKISGLFMFSYGPSIMDAELALSTLYETGTSRGYWFDPRVDELIGRQRAETDPARRKALIAEIWAITRANLPYMPLYNEVHSYGVSRRVTWTPRPDERLLFVGAEPSRK